ncbi:c-type cytochrome [Paramagnetospirillum magneticum]|uniref:Cytochrome c, mono-and diheme variants n=1 Tax=Paramagnetospirillum magneticum (strain ATCC 700264 / AMB-1) TaxID=342108 RepID=Q2W326_PARM1|nr:cytochrome c [Paramagnetospirillum magneticum]BAE51749.1 Cytochrome c, mono- and diheme variants [Paramagnetospirillum magneticum AMB-1]
MSEVLTKSAARNIFYGGTAFFFIVFVGLVGHSVSTVNDMEKSHPVTPSVAAGKHVWEKNACIDCHTIMGEGAYFAPELGNVWVRYGGREDAAAARDGLKNWIKSMPTGIEGRRQMPHFDITEKELDDLVDFFKWTSEVNTQNWPPKVSG